MTKTEELQTVPPPSKPAIALVAGYDVRGAPEGKNPYAGSNSDTLMLLRADPTNDTLSLLSFPRDLYVPIYCWGDAHHDVPYQLRLVELRQRPGRDSRHGGEADRPPHQLPDHARLPRLHADRRPPARRLHERRPAVLHRPRHRQSAINLQPGYQRLNGAQALSYVRYRHTDSDIYRNGRQQLFLDALKSRVKTISVLDALKVIGDLKHNVEIGKGGGGTVTPDELKSYLGLLYGLPAGHLFRNAIPLNDFHYFVSPGGADVESAPASAIHGAVQSFLHPDVRDAQTVNTQLGGRPKTPKKSKGHKLPTPQISVLVLNAGTVAGRPRTRRTS